MIPLENIPTLNACLNGIAAILLFAGRIVIKKGNRELHKKIMLAAFTVSILFLTFYLYYHFNSHLITRYEGPLRGVYLAILFTHIPLAAGMVPFICMALWYAIKGRFDRHIKIVRSLWPVWMYVSVTGVIIYLMLYQFS